MSKIMKPATVRYNGPSNEKFSHGKCYEAFFLEYWEGERDSLHVRGNDGRVTDFNKFEDFTVISDEDNLLNDYEAIVKCVTHAYDGELFDLNYGSLHKAIGRDKDGIAYPENWQEQVGVSYEIKQQRGRFLDAVSSADIRNHGTKVVNPFIGVIPTHGELEDELEQIYEAM